MKGQEHPAAFRAYVESERKEGGGGRMRLAGLAGARCLLSDVQALVLGATTGRVYKLTCTMYYEF